MECEELKQSNESLGVYRTTAVTTGALYTEEISGKCGRQDILTILDFVTVY